MIGTALRAGVRSATRRPGLVALLWAWNLALALLMTLPFWAWISRVSSANPETDVLLDGVDVGVIVQLLGADIAILPSLLAGVAGLVVLSLVSGAFLSGGILEVVLHDGDDRPLLHRFFRGAGHFFGRFLRLLIVAGLTAILAVALVRAVLTGATRPFRVGGSEPAAFWAGLAVQFGVGLAIVFFALALDYARAMTVLTGRRGMVRTWLLALRFVVRHLGGVTLIGIAAGVGVLLTIGALAAYDIAYGARTWAVIGGSILVQQAMALARTAVRVGQVGAQATYCAGFVSLGTLAPLPEILEPAPLPEPGPDVHAAGSNVLHTESHEELKAPAGAGDHAGETE